MAYGSNYTFVSINGKNIQYYIPATTSSLTVCSGGMNNQTYAAAGVEASLDSQFTYGLTYPTPATFYSTGGSPPYIPDARVPTDTNEPYVNVRLVSCSQPPFASVPASLITVAELRVLSRTPPSNDLH